jgi:hypothetical protein
MGYLCFIGWILLSGSLGGLVYSLTTGESHKLRMPQRIRDKKAPAKEQVVTFWSLPRFETTGIDTGFLGHMLIGAVGGTLLFSLTVSHLNFDVSPAIGDHRFSSSKPLPAGAVLVLIHTLGICAVGGFQWSTGISFWLAP